MKRLFLTLLRPLVLLLLIEGATALIVRLAPGYFADPNALDPALAEQVQAQMAAERAQSGNAFTAALAQDFALLTGRLGESRYYHVPVRQLLADRWPVTLRLLAGGLGLGWLLGAAGAALGLFRSRAAAQADRGVRFALIFLVAVPSGAMAALSVASGFGTPALVIAAFVAPRVYRFLGVLLRAHLSMAHILQARAAGLRTASILRVHVLPGALTELGAVAGTSLVLALGALIPVEVVFDLPGIAQLAWTSALNRDLPVIAATTLVIALGVALGAALGDFANPREAFAGDPGEVAG